MGHANERGIKPIKKMRGEEEGWRWEGAQKKKRKKNSSRACGASGLHVMYVRSVFLEQQHC